ncbi:MAG: ferredoxin [Spirochaetes bacterium GWF1_41_5]|nr:MAG: ferredoxin [Spirochaetes bacterium GWF1_41_5]
MIKQYEYLAGVTTLRLDDAACIGCGLCTQVCPHGVFKIQDKIAAIQNRDLCMECGACARNCPSGAIFVRPGVGCAMAIIMGKLRGTQPQCGCCEGGKEKSSCC